jgi:manganese/zinc/iron transport system permease protein
MTPPLPAPEYLDAARVLFTLPALLGGHEVMLRDLWVVLTAGACSVACALVGCFLVLRRMSLLGDAISHAVLPGLALAFIVTGTRDPLAMLAGAAGVGVLTAALSSGISRFGRVQEDAAMGVVFTSLFALGVLMITWVAPSVDLDPGCVLYGLIEFAGDDTIITSGVDASGATVLRDTGIPRPLVWLAGMMLVNIAAIWLFFKELRIVCFDPVLATSMGISAALVHYALMTLVAATTVVSFESVGSILVICMLVAPGATAALLTERLSRMLFIAAGLGVLSAVLGYALALKFNTSVAGMMSVVAGGLFAIAVVAAPRQGLIAKSLRHLRLSLRIAREDMLGQLYRMTEPASTSRREEDLPPVPPSSRFVTMLAAVVARVSGEVFVRDGRRALTPKGLDRAARIVRSHRLWESYLAKHMPLPIDHLHDPSHRVEHFITPEMRTKLADENPAAKDPHGKSIPPVNE